MLNIFGCATTIENYCSYKGDENWIQLPGKPLNIEQILINAHSDTKNLISKSNNIYWFQSNNDSYKACKPGRGELNCGQTIYTFTKQTKDWTEEPLVEIIACT